VPGQWRDVGQRCKIDSLMIRWLKIHARDAVGPNPAIRTAWHAMGGLQTCRRIDARGLDGLTLGRANMVPHMFQNIIVAVHAASSENADRVAEEV